MSLKNFSYIFLIDLPSRVFLDDFYCNTYYFAWTNLWYLGITVPVLFGLQCLYRRYALTYPVLVFTLVACVCTFSMNEYWHLNLAFPTWSLTTPLFNTLLLNSLNKYHPFLLYLSLSSFMVILNQLYFPELYKTSFRYTNPPQKNFSNLLKSFIQVNLTALLLGSWWAFQEGSWGGWWNWDISEIFGLYILILLLVFLHTNYPTLNTKFYFRQILLSLLFLAIFYFFMQLNFNLISHNFGLRLTYFFIDFNYIFFLSWSLIYSAYMVFIPKHRYNTLVPRLGLAEAIGPPVMLLSLLGGVSYLTFAALTLLLNNFSFLYFSINFCNWTPNFHSFLYYSFLTGYGLYWASESRFTYVLGSYLYLSYPHIHILFLRVIEPYFQITKLAIAHVTLFLIFFLSFNYSTKIFVYWSLREYLGIGEGLSGCFSLVGAYTPLPKLTAPLIELQVGGFTLPIHDYSYFEPAFSNKIFSLSLANCFSSQEFLPIEYLPQFSSTLYDPFLLILNLGLLPWILAIGFFFHTNFTLEK